MIANFDVVIENFRPGVMARFGLDYATLAKINPRLIYCSISGYGQNGPKAHHPAYAPVIHAASGFDMVNLHYQDDTTRPAASGIFIADVLGGTHAFGAIQTALYQRERIARASSSTFRCWRRWSACWSMKPRPRSFPAMHAARSIHRCAPPMASSWSPPPAPAISSN
jgi:hypothetical protein